MQNTPMVVFGVWCVVRKEHVYLYRYIIGLMSINQSNPPKPHTGTKPHTGQEKPIPAPPQG